MRIFYNYIKFSGLSRPAPYLIYLIPRYLIPRGVKLGDVRQAIPVRLGKCRPERQVLRLIVQHLTSGKRFDIQPPTMELELDVQRLRSLKVVELLEPRYELEDDRLPRRHLDPIV